VTTLNEARHETSHRYPSFLPGGRQFIYSAINLAAAPDDPANQIRVGSLDSKEDRAIIHSSFNTIYSQGYLLFVRGGTQAGVLTAQPFDTTRLETRGEPVVVADRVSTFSAYTAFGNFSVSDNGVLVYDSELLLSRLVWFDRSGRQLGTFGEPAELGDPRISPSGDRVAFSMYEPSAGKSQIWVGDFTRGIPTRLTNGPSENFRPVWSPDGKLDADRLGHSASAFELAD